MELYIKNMVCNRCITAVREVLLNLGLRPAEIELGIVKLSGAEPGTEQQQALAKALADLGFELLDSNRSKLIDQVKNKIIQRIYYSDDPAEKVNWSKLLSDAVFHEYNYLSALFSSVEGITIEQYIIRQKIERVKELLFYDELNLGEIANKLGYSSIAHLSSQFKKITGQTPSCFKKTRNVNSARKPIDKLL